MKKLLQIMPALLLFFSLQINADQEQVDALVNAVRQEAESEALYEEQRIDEFLQQHDRQSELLATARQELIQANALADRLQQNYEENEATLTNFETLLRERSGDLNDLFAIVRQAALSADNVLGSSLVAAQTGHLDFLQALGQGKRTPTIEDITSLWSAVFTEISESGKVVRFNATVVKPQGDEVIQPVVRAGVFSAVSDGAFLRYLPDAGKFVELSRQPVARYQRMASKLENSDGSIEAMALDPSKGAILSLMVQSPDLMERIQQGGGIGYLILLLGAFGVLTILRRAIGLFLTRRAIDKQAISDVPSQQNALGRLQYVAVTALNDNPESVEVLLDEQLSEEASRLNRGLPIVAVLAAVSPLLGLLGTVTGMIETFQSITLFGTGDPKLMSGGISQALITTQLGLAVAIPLVLFHSILTGRVNRLIERLGKYTSDVVASHESI